MFCGEGILVGSAEEPLEPCLEEHFRGRAESG